MLNLGHIHSLIHRWNCHEWSRYCLFEHICQE